MQAAKFIYLTVGFAILCLSPARALTCRDSAVIGETYVFNVSLSSQQNFCFQLNSSTETQAIRVFVESEGALLRHPVLVTVRQSKGVLSWAIPYVESGFSYMSVERTLCPLLNNDESEPSGLLVDFSTSYNSSISVTLRTSIVTPFRLELDEPVTLKASPSGPAYLLFEYPPEDTRVRVKFASSENTSHICAIASLQTAYCPVVELLDNPDHRGRYQTMRSIAAIHTYENDTEPHFGFFYVVLTVFPNDGRSNSCVFNDQGLGNEFITLDSAANNFNPTMYFGEDRVKAVIITIEPELSVNGYVVAGVIPVILYSSFFVFAVAYIVFVEWLRPRFNKHRVFRYLQNCEDVSNVEHGIDLNSGTALGDQTSDIDKKSIDELHGDQEETADQLDGQSSVKPKRPNLLKVLKGTQWSKGLRDAPVSDPARNVAAPSDSATGVASDRCSEGDVQGGDLGEGGVRNREGVVIREVGVVIQEESVCMFPANLSELKKIDDSSSAQKVYNNYFFYLLVIIVFYSIPAYQLVVTYQKLLTVSGNEDICYYNSLCARPWDVYSGLSISAFNNIFSNVGYVFLGILFIYTAYRRRNTYRIFEKINSSCKAKEKVGVPQRFGIYYAIGVVMVAQAFMSIAYHMCPSSNNYQFDATFMYVLAVLGMYKLLKSRCPDLDDFLYKIAVCLGIIIIAVVLGGVLLDTVWFKVIYVIVYLITLFVFSVEFYHRWQIRPRWSSIKALFLMYKRDGLCPPKHIPRLVIIVISLVVNIVLAGCVFVVTTIGLDFAKAILFTLVINLMIYLVYYSVTKCVYREVPSFKPIIFTILAFATWVVAFYFFTRDVINWSESPALSRERNAECLVLSFYDSHDMWHFVSAFAVFFSFLILMTLDDKQKDQQRNTLRSF